MCRELRVFVGLLYLSIASAGTARAELVTHLTLDGNLLDPVSGNDGTYVGGPETYVEGFDGTPAGAVSFDGASYVRLAHTAGLPLRNSPALTVAMWVKGGAQTDRRVFSESNVSGNGTPLYNIGTDNTGTTAAADIFIREDGGTRVNHFKTGALFDNTWHHVTVIDDNGQVSVYIDAVLSGTVSYTRNVLTVNATTLGAILRATAGAFFTGAIDEVRLYDHALSLTEILALVPVPAGCFSRYSLDGNTLDSVSGNDGTYVGGAETYVDGFDGTPGGAMLFDGASLIDIAQNVSLPLSDNPIFSVALWVKGPVQADKRVFSEGSTTSNDPLYNIGTGNTAATGASLDLFIRRDTGQGTPINHFKTARAAFDDEWHHVAVVDDDGVVTLYIDGVEEGSGFRYDREPLTTNTTTLGGILRATACCQFTGALDEVRFYSRAISAEEVASLVPEPDDCPEEGDTTCDLLTAVGPEGRGGPGIWTFTVDGAADASEDPVFYRFLVEHPFTGARIHLGPTTESTASADLGLEGTWIITALVDDSILCRDPAAVCTTEAFVVLDPPRVIAELPLDGNLADITGNGNNGSFAGAASPSFVTGVNCMYPGAVSFDGVDDIITLTAADALPITNSPRFSVAMWVNGVPTPEMRDRRVFSEGFSGGNNNSLFNIGTDSANPPTGVVDLFVRNDAGTQLLPHVKSTGIAFDGTWHHIAWVDDRGQAKLYIDGVEDATDFSYAKQAITFDTTTIGAIQRATACCWFPGLIDDVRIYNFALTPEEVEMLAVAPPDCPQVAVLAGDCDGNGLRDISDIICGVRILFSGFLLIDQTPQEPPCANAGGNRAVLDLSGDGTVNVSDIVRLASFLFLGGADPAQGLDCFEIPEDLGCAVNLACP